MEVVFVGFVAIELVLFSFGVALAISIMNERRRIDRNIGVVLDRLDEIEERLKSPEERARDRERRRRMEQQKRLAFQVYGLDEGT